jgi:hypothetical protein
MGMARVFRFPSCLPPLFCGYIENYLLVLTCPLDSFYSRPNISVKCACMKM